MLRENGIHLLPHLLADMLWNGTHHVSVQLTPEYLLITRKFTAKPNGQRMNFHRELLQSLAMEQGFQSALGITPTPKEPLRYERLLLHTREIEAMRGSAHPKASEPHASHDRLRARS